MRSEEGKGSSRSSSGSLMQQEVWKGMKSGKGRSNIKRRIRKTMKKYDITKEKLTKILRNVVSK